jgi:hypothetical protein
VVFNEQVSKRLALIEELEVKVARVRHQAATVQSHLKQVGRPLTHTSSSSCSKSCLCPQY